MGAEPPEEGALPLRKVQGLRYGENPHQRAVFYASPLDGGRSLARAEVLQGKALSFNNLGDLDATLRAAFEADARLQVEACKTSAESKASVAAVCAWIVAFS